MSKYKQIVTQFKNLESLKKALEDVGFAGIEVAPNPKAPSLTLVGFLGDARPEKASLRIPRRYVGSLQMMWASPGTQRAAPTKPSSASLTAAPTLTKAGSTTSSSATLFTNWCAAPGLKAMRLVRQP